MDKIQSSTRFDETVAIDEGGRKTNETFEDFVCVSVNDSDISSDDELSSFASDEEEEDLFMEDEEDQDEDDEEGKRYSAQSSSQRHNLFVAKRYHSLTFIYLQTKNGRNVYASSKMPATLRLWQLSFFTLKHPS